MNGKDALIFTAFTIGGAAALYRVYNIWTFRRWQDKKNSHYRRTTEEAQYQLFLTERREKRWNNFKFVLWMIGSFTCGYIFGLLDQDNDETYPENINKNQVEEVTI